MAEPGADRILSPLSRVCCGMRIAGMKELDREMAVVWEQDRNEAGATVESRSTVEEACTKPAYFYPAGS